jgi:hypothetical protein
LTPLKKNLIAVLIYSLIYLRHQQCLFYCKPSPSAGKPSRLSNLPDASAHVTDGFSGGKVSQQTCQAILQMGEVIFPARESLCKWEQSLFRRGSHFANWRSHFSGGKVIKQMGKAVLQICQGSGALAKSFF